MADDYKSGLNILLGDLAKNDVTVPSPEQAINQQYDAPMEGTSTLSSMIQGLDNSSQEDITFNRMAQGQAASQLAADEYGKLDELTYGSAPNQQIVDPNAMIGSAGERVERGLKAGWGDLLYGTGETVDFINAWARPGDVEPSTSVGEWFQKIGTEYQNENALILSEDLKDITFQDMFKGEFWSSKISKLVPYAMSFVIPYGGGAKIGASLLGRFGVFSAKGISKANKLGKVGVPVGAMGKGIGMGGNGIKGSGILGKLAYDGGKKGYAQTKFMRNIGGFVGGGAAANMAEGAYLSGEAYTEMLHEVNPDGSKRFTPSEAADHAAGVMTDNAKWMGVDMVQYGLLFGGIGKNMAKRLLLNPLKSNPFKASIKGLTAHTVRKVLPNLPAAGAYASVEGITEGIQETYQEWIKYTNIQEAKGEDYESMTDWVKDEYGNYKPEIRDLFWSSVGLGGAMGGTRGYFDSAAARNKALNEHQEAVNTNAQIMDAAKTPDQQYVAEQMVQDNIISLNVWNYRGDGSIVMEYVNNMVKDKKMDQQTADEYIQAIEQAEKNYEKHTVNSMLTETGAKQAFFRETRKSRNQAQQALQIASYENDKAVTIENIKDEKKQKKALSILEQNHLSIMETLDQDMAVLNREIEDIYTLRVDKAPTAKSTGKRDARFKVQGLTKDEINIYGQEGAKEAEAEAKKKADADPSIISKVVKGAKELGGKAVEGAKGLFGKAKDKVTSKETKKAIEDVKKYTKEEITPSAKEKLVKALEAGKIGIKAALKIIGSGVNKIINNKDVKEAIEKFKEAKKETVEAAEEKKQESDKDVKKKDQPQVVPKTEEYSKTEEALKKKGIQLEAASISKVVDKEGKANTTSYMLKTATGKVIKFFTSKPFGAEALTKTPQNIKLNLVEPVAGMADVVEVNGKLYFQYQKGAPLYESKIQVIVGDKVIGQLEYQSYKKDTGPVKKAKKTDIRTIDKVIGSVKQTKESFKKLLDKSFKNIPAQEDILINRNLEVYTHSGLGAAALTRSIVQKQFPGARGYVISSKLADDYGQEATSLAIGSVVLINENQVEQTDLIHELGHVYYGLMEDTPLMKRIKKLLPKSSLYQKTREEYPELTLMSYKGNNLTLGSIYRNALNNKPDATNDVISIAENIAIAERQGDSARSTELFNNLRIQLKAQGVKDVRVDQQRHLLEETFTRTLEAYSKGTVDSVVKGSEAQELLKKDLIEFYKKTKKLATDEEAKRLLDLSVDNIQSLDLEASIKHILLDFNSGERTIPVVQNSAYGDIKRANKKAFASRATYSAVSSYIGDFIGRSLTPTVMTNRVMKRIAEDSNLKVADVKQLREYVKAIIVQITRPADLKLADKTLDNQLSDIGLDLNEKENMDQASESDQYKESNKIIALPTTTSNFIKKITEVYNFKNPDNVINRKKLLYDMYVIAKSTQNDPFDFIPTLRKSDSAEIMAMLRVLDGVYGKDKVLTNAKLMELKGPIEGINIEVLTQQALEIGYMGARKWKTYKTMSKTLEAGVINDVMNNLKENTGKGKRIAQIYDNLFYNSKENKFKEVLDENDINTAAKRVLSEILDDTNKGVLIDKDALLNARILFKGKRQTLSQILFNHTRFKNGKPNLENQSLMGITKEGKFAAKIGKYEAKGLIYGKQGELKVILTEGLVASRAINYLSMVDNVEGDGISVFNKENGLHNRAKNVATIINNETIIESDSVMHPNNNIYADMAFRKKQAGVLSNSEGKVTTNPFNFTIHSGMMRTLVTRADGVKYEGRASKLNSVTPSELIAGDFFSFLSKYNELMAGNEAMGIYDQAIAVFSDKSRRYYVESIIAHNDKMKKLLLTKVKNNPAYNAKYLKGSKVFPYTIENGKIKEMPSLIKKWKEYANKNAELFKGNTDLKEVKNLDSALDAFLTSYIANKFMAQQLFVHDHRQSKDQIDYIKRAAGSIASHIVFDRNTQIEPIIIKDYFVDEEGNIGTDEKEGTAIENDAMGYVLPEQAKYIRAKYGEVQKVGNVFKFVYHYTETEGKLKGNTTYLKFAVHTLTPKLESTSPYLKNIGDMLRKRQEQVQEMSNTPGNLVIAASESAAKLFFDGPSGKTGSKYVYDVSTSENIDQIMASQDEIYKGDNGYQALSGEGLGIQLELDKQASERFFPSQLFYNLATNIETKEEQAIVEEMFILRQRVMEANNYSRNNAGEQNGLIVDNMATESQVLQERDGFKSSVSADVFGVLLDSVFPKVDPRYPFVSASYNSIATGRITHKGTKMYTKGSIAYQSASLGMGLQSYKEGLFKGDESVIASEAIVPGYLQKDGVKKGDLFIGTRVPAHGKVSSSIFVVKDFHDQIGNSPTSNITIPAHVSKNWGADLDGDSVHMNFKWTNAEVKKKGKEWREFSNEFFDKYVQLISQPKRQAEIKADINFENAAKEAIAKAESIYGSKAKQEESQLTPMGDAQMFEDNVPAKNLVGIIAALQRTFNIFSNTEEKLPFSIKINNKTEDKFFDDSSLEGGVGNWFGVAQLLNIALDNAKHQFAGKLGIDMQSVFPYVTLRRLGYSLNDLSVLFNSPIVKEYMEFKRSRSKNYISKDSDIKEMFLEDQTINFNELVMFLEKRGVKGLTTKTEKGRAYNQKAWDKLANRITGGVEINLDALSKEDATAEIDTILMLYGLNKYNQDIVRPFSKAFTVHQTIEKNPLELRKIRDDIARIQAGPVIINEKAKAGGLNISYTLGASSRNSIVQHAMGLFDSVLERAQRTDIRYTQYMRDIINDATFQELNQNKLTKPKIINQIIINNLKNKIEFLNPNALKDGSTLIEEFKLLQGRNKENKFLNRIIEVNEKGNKVVINRAEITEFTSYKAIEQIKESFNQLTETEKDFVFALEAQFNGFGFTGGAGAAGSFVPFFDDVYIEKINKSISAIIEENQTREANLVGSLATEYTDARSMLGLGGIISGNQKYSTEDKVDIASKLDNSFVDPTRKAKKIISSDTSYNNDYLGSGVRMLSIDTWARDKGIDLSKISPESDTFTILRNRYDTYREQYRLVKEFEAKLESKPLSSYKMDNLYKLGVKFRKMDNSATKGIAHTIEKEIGQRAFAIQSEKLRRLGAKQGYEYNTPGVDGVAQEDISNFQKWLGSNDMTSKRPEIQYLINEVQEQYRAYLRAFTKYKNIIESANRSLKRSKMKSLSILERVRQGFDANARYEFIYGNIATLENGNIRLLSEQEINEKELTQEEINYYNAFKKIGSDLLNVQDVVVPGMQMGNIESMSRSGLFGLYNTTIDSSDYNRVRVRGVDKNGDKVYKTFYEWKYDVYKGRSGSITLESGKKINELEKLRKLAKDYKSRGMHMDGETIMLSDAEYDALINNGSRLKRMMGDSDTINNIDAELIQEYERRRGVKAATISYDIHSGMLEFVRSSLFMHGENLQKNPDGFSGMNKMAVLTDSIIGFNKGLDNKKAVEYLTKWWKEGFLEKKQQEGVLGKTGDKIIDGFVRLTSLRLLGFNMGVGVGNILAGKYQELRKRGGKQFILGEKRYWVDGKDKSWNLLKKHRIVEYSFDEFIHLSERKGLYGTLERWSYIFMDRSESYIQGAAFLGELTQREYDGLDPITDKRVMQINHKISTLHGEGYTALDASTLSMYSYGRALMQFKKWFVTTLRDRLKPEDINRFGEVNIGSYRASGEFVVNLFRKYFAGEITKKNIIDIFNESSKVRQKEIINHLNGIGIGVTLLSLIALAEDDDDIDSTTLRTMKKLSHDVFVTTDINRFTNYTIKPSSYSTLRNATKVIGEAVRGDKVKRSGPYGDKGDSQAMKTLKYDIAPLSEARKDMQNIFFGDSEPKKETSSLIR